MITPLSRLTRKMKMTAGAAGAAAAVATAVVGAGSPASAAQVVQLPAFEAHCYSTYGEPGDVALGVFDTASPYPRAVRILFRNDASEPWRPATDWNVTGANDLIHFTATWDNPGQSATWHQYELVVYAQTSQGWEFQGAELAHAFNALTPGGTQNDSPYPGWCKA
jgi:hypothetical protein